MVVFARALSALGVDIITFNFPYAEQGRRLPDRGPTLEDCYRRVITTVHDRVDSAGQNLFIGGKSMGGRIATQVAAADRELPVAGLVLLGYPLHPPGRPQQRRDAHLAEIGRPLLFVQGRRDTFGTPDELAPVLSALAPTSPSSILHVVEAGDHSFTLSRKDPAAQAAVYADVQRTIVDWIGGISRTAAP
jgi:predicted alpha/beta-hydrolase family hydrolase